MIYYFGEYKTTITQKKDEYSKVKYYNCKEIPRVLQCYPDELEVKVEKI